MTKLGVNEAHPASPDIRQQIIDAKLPAVLVYEENLGNVVEYIEAGIKTVVLRFMRRGDPSGGNDAKPDDWHNHAMAKLGERRGGHTHDETLALGAERLAEWGALAREHNVRLLVQHINEVSMSEHTARLERELALRLNVLGVGYLAGNPSTGTWNEDNMREYYKGWGLNYLDLFPTHVVMGFHEGSGPHDGEHKLLGFPWSWGGEWQGDHLVPPNFPSPPPIFPLTGPNHLTGRYYNYVHPEQLVLISEIALGSGWQHVSSVWVGDLGLPYDLVERFVADCYRWFDDFYSQDPRVLAACIFCTEEHFEGRFWQDAIFPGPGDLILDRIMWQNLFPVWMWQRYRRIASAWRGYNMRAGA